MKTCAWTIYLTLFFLTGACGNSSKPVEYSAKEVSKDFDSLQKISNESASMKENAFEVTIDEALEAFDRWIETIQKYEEKYSKPHRIGKLGSEQIEDPELRMAIKKDGHKTRRLLNSDRAILRGQARDLQAWRLKFQNLKRKYGGKTTLWQIANGSPNIAGSDQIETITLPYMAPTAKPKEVGRILPPGTGIVGGSTLAPNRRDIIPNALVYIPDETANEGQKNSPLAQDASEAKISFCGEPTQAYLAKTCSDEFGYFEFVGLSPGPVEAVFQIGSASRRFSTRALANRKVRLTAGETSLPPVDYLDPSDGLAPKVAIISNDERESIRFVSKFLNGYRNYKPGDFANFKVIVVAQNAMNSSLLNDSSFHQNIETFLLNGGSLLVLGNSFEMVEKLSSRQVDFLGEQTGAAKPQEAKGLVGTETPAALSANVADKNMLSWLKAVKCWNETRKENIANCVGADSTLSFSEVPYGGNLIQGLLTENSPIIWLDWNKQKDLKLPLAVSFNFGKGKIIYSVIHGSSNLSEDALLPEDRVLQYLLIEALRL